MKRNAIVRIVIYSLVILLLLGLLATGLGVGTYIFNWNRDEGEYVSGSGSVNAADVRNLDIAWASGTVTIVPGDTDEIQFTEEGHADKGQPMSYSLMGGTLSICYGESRNVYFGFTSVAKKDLTITVPRDWDCGKLSIDAASTDLDIRNLTIGTLDLDGASMDCSFTDCNVQDLDVDGASCNIHFTGTLYSLKCDGASASLTAVCSNAPDSIDFDGASAALDLTLPQDCGFRVELDGMSCEFKSDFATTTSDGCHTYGDGHCQINVDGMSASVNIRNGGSQNEDDHQ